MLNNNYIETRAQSGYQSMLMYKKGTDSKYHILLPLETVPSAFGTQNSFEFDLLNAATTGKVKGKMSIDDKEGEFLLHRDNIYRLQELIGSDTIDLLYVAPDLVGWHYVGTVTYRPNDAGNDVLKGTLTLTCTSIDTDPIYDVRGLIEESIIFTNTVAPSLDDNLDTTGKDVRFEVSEDITTANVTVAIKDGNTTSTAIDNGTVTMVDGNNKAFTIKFKQASGASTGTHYAIAYVTVTKNGYGPWTTTISLKTVKE